MYSGSEALTLKNMLSTYERKLPALCNSNSQCGPYFVPFFGPKKVLVLIFMLFATLAGDGKDFILIFGKLCSGANS